MTRCATALFSVCYLLALAQALPASDLDAELRDLSAMRKGKGTDLTAIDKRGAKLLETYSAPAERGRIYYELANAHAQSGMLHPERVIEYTQKALENPLQPSQKERLYVYWGDALQLANPTQPFPDRRKAATRRYLEGLKALLEYNLPTTAPELPIVLGFDADPTSGPIYEALMRKNEQEVAARKQAEFQREMIKHRDVLVGQIAGLYGRKPHANDEIADAAHQSLGDSPLVSKLMEAVDAEVKADDARNPPVVPPTGPPSGVDGPLRWWLTGGSLIVFAAIGCWLAYHHFRKKSVPPPAS